MSATLPEKFIYLIPSLFSELQQDQSNLKLASSMRLGKKLPIVARIVQKKVLPSASPLQTMVWLEAFRTAQQKCNGNEPNKREEKRPVRLTGVVQYDTDDGVEQLNQAHRQCHGSDAPS
jgi:hypothetical protein